MIITMIYLDRKLRCPQTPPDTDRQTHFPPWEYTPHSGRTARDCGSTNPAAPPAAAGPHSLHHLSPAGSSSRRPRNRNGRHTLIGRDYPVGSGRCCRRFPAAPRSLRRPGYCCRRCRFPRRSYIADRHPGSRRGSDTRRTRPC